MVGLVWQIDERVSAVLRWPKAALSTVGHNLPEEVLKASNGQASTVGALVATGKIRVVDEDDESFHRVPRGSILEVVPGSPRTTECGSEAVDKKKEPGVTRAAFPPIWLMRPLGLVNNSTLY